MHVSEIVKFQFVKKKTLYVALYFDDDDDDDGFSRRKPAHEYPRHINDAFFRGSGARFLSRKPCCRCCIDKKGFGWYCRPYSWHAS